MRITFLALAVIFLSAQGVAGTSSPDDVAQEFYSWILSQPDVGSGLPTAKEQERLTTFFSPALLHLLETASAMEKRCIENNTPGDKPHIIEGNVFVGHYEGATEIIVGKSRNEGKNSIVESRLFSIDARFPKSHKHRVYTWVDQLIINQYGDKWLVSNIKFEAGESLVSFLDEYLKTGAEWCDASSASLNSNVP